MAEKFPNFNPYNYTLQNPINLTDPTGMEPEGSGDPIRNVILCIDSDNELKKFEAEHKSDPKQGWNVIFANTIEGAKNELIKKGYGSKSIDNLVIRSHASSSELAIGGNFLHDNENNHPDKNIDVNSFYNFFEKPNSNSKEQMKQISSLQAIGNFINDDGRLIFTGCNAGSSPSIPEFLMTLYPNRKFDMFFNQGLGGLNFKNKSDSIKCNNPIQCPNSDMSGILRIFSNDSHKYYKDLILNNNNTSPVNIIEK